MADESGVWRTISGRRVFIKDGQSLTDAMRESGKFSEEGRNELQNKEKYGEVVRLKDGTYLQIAEHGDLEEIDGKPCGLRTLPSETKKKYLVGSEVPDSYDWDHEADVSTFYTNKAKLSGASALGINVDDDVTSVEKLGEMLRDSVDKTYSEWTGKVAKYGEADDKHRIIVGDGYESGEDKGEIVISNPRVWGIVYKYDSADQVRTLKDLGVKSGKAKAAAKTPKMTKAMALEEYSAYTQELCKKYDAYVSNLRMKATESEIEKWTKLKQQAGR